MPYIGNIVQDFSVNTAMLNSDSVTSIKIDDGTIVNADINASAAIDVSKLSGVLPLAGGTLTGDLTIPEKLIHAGDTDTFIRFPSGNAISAETNGSERLRLDSAGRVLYGKTSNRQTRLGGNSFSPNIQIEDSSIASVSLSRFNDNGSPFRFVIQKARGSIASPAAVINNDVAGQILFSAYDGSEFCNVAKIDAEVDGTPGTNDMPGTLTFSTTSDGANAVTERMRIASTGRIGIGEANPDTLLHLKDSSPRITLEDTGTDAKFRINADSSVGNASFDVDINSDTSDPSFIVNIKGGEQLRLTSGGSLGIGTASPQYKLHQHAGSSGSNYHQFTNDTTGSGAAQGMLIGLNSNEEFIVYNRENTALRFGTNNQERARITNNGEILIGNTTVVADTKVIVDGNINQYNSDTGTGASTKSYVLGRAYTMSTSSTNLLTFDNWGTAAFDITVFRRDNTSPAGANVTKVYLAFHGSGQNITQASIAQESKVTRGTIHNTTFGISENNNTATLTVTGDNNGGEAQDFTFHIIGRGNGNGSIVVA